MPRKFALLPTKNKLLMYVHTFSRQCEAVEIKGAATPDEGKAAKADRDRHRQTERESEKEA